LDTDCQSTAFVVGLGNPGPEYRDTRHNVGFRVVEELVQRWDGGSGRMAFSGRLFDARVRRRDRQRRVMLLEPLTYMNRSGQAVAELVGFFKALPADVLVVLDDLALPPGQLRLRADGSSGGHKGLASVLESLGTQAVARLRIGIGSLPPQMDGADYVLQAFAKGEREAVQQAVHEAGDAVEDWLFDGMDAAMERHNRRPADQAG